VHRSQREAHRHQGDTGQHKPENEHISGEYFRAEDDKVEKHKTEETHDHSFTASFEFLLGPPQLRTLIAIEEVQQNGEERDVKAMVFEGIESARGRAKKMFHNMESQSVRKTYRKNVASQVNQLV
jgi:hypothetical protein